MRALFALTLAAGLGSGAAASRAMTVLPGPSLAGDPIIQVQGGCGPGGHRDFYGYCRPNYGPPPRFYRCPPYTHPTPYGCRPNY